MYFCITSLFKLLVYNLILTQITCFYFYWCLYHTAQMKILNKHCTSNMLFACFPYKTNVQNRSLYVPFYLNLLFILFVIQNILKALRRATKDKTSMCIAHRLSTIKDADEILILRNGKILERGTHQHLIDNNASEYTELWNIQQDTTNKTP